MNCEAAIPLDALAAADPRGRTAPDLFAPARLGSLRLRNRLVMSPMQQYQGAADARATAHHVHHYARRARGGVGLVMVESTAVAPEGRLFGDDIGLYSDAHVAPLRAVVDAVHAEGAAIAVQLSHGGRKSFRGTGPLLAPSAIAFDAGYGTPQAMSQAQIDAAVAAYGRATRYALQAGFDAIELHAAHGFLVHQFLSPIGNRRDDRYGGSARNRGRFLREAFAAIRRAAGPDYPLLVRVSGSDFDPQGLAPEDVAELLRPLRELGLQAVDVSAGGISPAVPYGIGVEYQVPFAATIRRALAVPTIAVGLIRGAERAQAILDAGHADFIAIGRPLLERPDYAEDLRRARGGRAAS
ncbi:oxidoreductase [Luteimonas aquatica]|uniref:oxidoreductase n=1 Tax=Luteimonas aquatica TaxID=450364 RepID=UPI001F588966|nr:oxidoreductase [Luteimonas aquatica]